MQKKLGAVIGVDRASFEVRSGEIFVIMGLSGSGKSTIVRLLNRLIEPTSGEILLDGRDLAKMSKDELIEGLAGSRAASFRKVVEALSLVERRAVCRAHELPGWVDALAPVTPQTRWTSGSDLDHVVAAGAALGAGPAVARGG